MLEKLKKAKIAAMKEKNVTAKLILSLLHSDALSMAKKETREVAEDDIIASAKSLIKKNKQAIADAKEHTGKDLPEIEKEIEILMEFLPEQLSEDEMKTTVDYLISKIPEDERTRRAQGGIMKSLKEKYGNSIDMGIASKYVGTKLS